MLVNAMQYRLHIPGYTVRLLIDVRKGWFIYQSMLGWQQAIGKLPINRLFDARQRQHQGTLEERTVCRKEHLLHHVLLTARKYEIHIRQKLDVGTNHRLYPILINVAILLLLSYYLIIFVTLTAIALFMQRKLRNKKRDSQMFSSFLIIIIS